jgi:hypothetical protein
VLGQPMVEDLSINPYPFYSFDATAGQQFHIGVNDISVEDTGLWIYGTDRTTLLYDYDQDNCGAFEGTVCSESVDCPPDSPLCGGYAEEAEFTAPADGTYYAMGHSLSVGGDYGWTSGFTEPTELSLTVRDTWPGGPTPPPPPVVACVGAWSDWSACSEPCGPAGVRQLNGRTWSRRPPRAAELLVPPPLETRSQRAAMWGSPAAKWGSPLRAALAASLNVSCSTSPHGSTPHTSSSRKLYRTRETRWAPVCSSEREREWGGI